jgi:hypothetical protein
MLMALPSKEGFTGRFGDWYVGSRVHLFLGLRKYNRTVYGVQNPVYALWDMSGERRLNGEPFNANEIYNSKGTGYLAFRFRFNPTIAMTRECYNSYHTSD